MEDGLFPHSRSLYKEAAMEEERRLYVGMTRAEKRLVLSWAKYRRRFGGGEQERTIASRFLREIPSNLVISLGVDEDEGPQVDLTAERWDVRQGARKNLYTGKTLNSVQNVAQYFKERGVNIPVRLPAQSGLSAGRCPCQDNRAVTQSAPASKAARTNRYSSRSIPNMARGPSSVARARATMKVTVIFQRHDEKIGEKYAQD